MSRPLRVEYPGAVYHVTARGNDRRPIYRDDPDRTRFLELLEEAASRYGLLVHGYCLMPNHYHLLLQTPRGNLSAAMAWLQTSYCVWFNRRHHRSGHVVQGRYKAIVVEADAYAQALLEYVHLNPVRPRDKRAEIPLQRRAELAAYRWSSHQAYAGLEAGPAWLCQEWLSYWAQRPKAARRAYARAIDQRFGAAAADPLREVRGGLVLGGEGLWGKVRRALGRGDGAAIRWQERADEPAVRKQAERLMEQEVDGRVRIWIAVKLAGRPMSELGRELGYADGSGVLRVVQRLEAAARSDPKLADHLRKLQARFELSSVKR